MINSVNKKLVLIRPDKIAEKAGEDGKILKAEETKQREQRSQNRGVVVLVGEECGWAKKDDYLSFYRGAGTDIPEDGETLIIIHEDHCLAKIIKSEKK
jgi:hypothetical protein